MQTNMKGNWDFEKYNCTTQDLQKTKGREFIPPVLEGWMRIMGTWK